MVVLLAHTLSGLAPRSAAYPHPGSLAFAALNGSAAVAFFFVLSGFVLPQGYFHSRRPRMVAVALVRRWPRLAGPTTVACVASWMLFATGAYHYQQAGMLSGSHWLQTMGNALFPAGFVPSAMLPSNDVIPLLWDCGACLLIGAVLGCRHMGALLSTRVAASLGRVSFPVYLLHFPILCSLGSWTYASMLEQYGDGPAIAAGAGATLAATLGGSLPLAAFDQWWVRQVKRGVAELPAITARPSRRDPPSGDAAVG